MSKKDSITVTILYNSKYIKINRKTSITLEELKNASIKGFKLEKNLEQYISFFYEDDDGDMNLIENEDDIKKFKKQLSNNNYLLKLKLILIEKEILVDGENDNKKYDIDFLKKSSINNQTINRNSNKNTPVIKQNKNQNQTPEERKKQLLSQLKQEKEKNKRELEKIKNNYSEKLVSIMKQQEEEIKSLKKKLSDLKQGSNKTALFQETNLQQNSTEYINEILNNYDIENEIKEINNIFDDSKLIIKTKQKLGELFENLKGYNKKFIDNINQNHKDIIQNIQNKENYFKNTSKDLETKEASFTSEINNNKKNQNNKTGNSRIIKKKSDKSNNISSKCSKEINEEPKDNKRKGKKIYNKDNNQEYEDNTIDTEKNNTKDKIKKINKREPVNVMGNETELSKDNNEQSGKSNDLSINSPKPIKPENKNKPNNIIKKEMKKETKKGYELIKKIFFTDNYYKEIKKNEPSEKDYKEIADEIQEERKASDTTLKTFCLDFIKKNVVTFIRNCNDDNLKKKIIERMEHVLEFCCGINKNIFQDAITNKRKVIKYDRNKSAEVVANFRKEFGISEEIFSDEAVTRKLEANNYDIHKAFQDFYG